MANVVKTIAVIGAGPAGAIVADALVKEQAFDKVRVFDRRPVVGGTWVFTPHLPAKIPNLEDVIAGRVDNPVEVPPILPVETPKSEAINSHQVRFSDTAQHENLHSNIDPSIMSYSQEPFPRTHSERILKEYGPGAPMRHREVVREWVEGLFARHAHRELLELNTTVERAVKTDGKWVLTLRKEGPAKNYWWEEKFDALVVASGHYNVPWIPRIRGIVEYDKRFPGRVVHSKHFRDPSKFAGKRVIVAGGSVSSSEIIHEVLPYASHPVYGSLRGEPIPVFGLVPWTHPHVVVKPQITNFDAETGRIFFEDGSVVDNIDHVIFGTGYTFSFPFLPDLQKKVKTQYRRLPGVYQHTWNIEDPTLAFVGMLGGGFTFRVYEWQAVAVARHLAGRAKPLPSVEEQREWERKRVAELGGGKSYYSIAPNYRDFFELLRDIAGDPAPGTTGRVLPQFDKKWLDIWAGMIATRIQGWERSRKRAELAEATQVRAKL